MDEPLVQEDNQSIKRKVDMVLDDVDENHEVVNHSNPAMVIISVLAERNPDDDPKIDEENLEEASKVGMLADDNLVVTENSVEKRRNLVQDVTLVVDDESTKAIMEVSKHIRIAETS